MQNNVMSKYFKTSSSVGEVIVELFWKDSLLNGD